MWRISRQIKPGTTDLAVPTQEKWDHDVRPLAGGRRLEQDVADVFLPSIVHQMSFYRNLLVGFEKNISSELSNYIDACTGTLNMSSKPLLVVGDTL